MFHKSTKIIAGISIGIFLLSVTACVVAFVVVTKQKESYIEYEKKRAEAEAHEALRDGLVKSLDKTADERALLTSQILKEDVIELLSLIETIGKEQGVALTTNSLDVESLGEEEKTFEILVIRLEVIGSYESVMRMLALLEHIPYQATVDSLQLERQGEGALSLWKGTFGLRVVKFKKYETQS